MDYGQLDYLSRRLHIWSNIAVILGRAVKRERLQLRPSHFVLTGTDDKRLS